VRRDGRCAQAEVVSRQKELNLTPGAEYLYCNTDFTLLAQIVRRASGESLREFTWKRILRPLGMKSTHFRDDPAEIVKHIAYAYVDGGGENSYRLSVTNFVTVGATNLLTTVDWISGSIADFPPLVTVALRRAIGPTSGAFPNSISP
jgi:CubicO group peptidase (beta-lactamase class C family)